MLFSEKIRYLMKQKGITQRALSEKIGVNQPTISRWFNGQEPYSKALSRLSEEFNIPVELLQSDNLSEDEFISKLYIIYIKIIYFLHNKRIYNKDRIFTNL